MAGLFSGVIGTLIGSGIQAALGNAPQTGSPALDLLRAGGSSLPSADLFAARPTEQQTTQQMYNKIEQHLNGAIQIVGPCMKLLNALNTVHPSEQSQNFRRPVMPPRKEWEDNLRASSKAASVNNRGSTTIRKEPNKPPTVISLCTPEKKISRASSCGCKSSEDIENRKKISELRLRHFSNSEVENNRQAANVNGSRYAVEEKKSKIHPMASSSPIAVDKSHSSRRSQNKPVKTSSNVSRLRVGSCQMCQIQLNDVNTPGLMSCGHVYCYRCLTGRNITKCPRCGQKIDLKKIRGLM